MNKLLLLSLITSFAFTLGCSEDDKTAQPIKEEEKLVLPDVEDVQYAGLVVFELGTIEGDPNLFGEDNREPISRINFCIRADSETTQKGSFRVNFKDLGVVGTIDHAFDLTDRKRKKLRRDSLDINYEMDGIFETTSNGGFYGLVNFNSGVSNITWRDINDDGSLGELVDSNRYSDSISDHSLTKEYWHGTMMSYGITTNEYMDTKFYISSTIIRAGASQERGIHLIEMCEGQEKDVFSVMLRPDLD